MDNHIIMRAQNVSKLYGINKAEAIKLIKEGTDKETVHRKTGVTVALWDVSFEIKRGQAQESPQLYAA